MACLYISEAIDCYFFFLDFFLDIFFTQVWSYKFFIPLLDSIRETTFLQNPQKGFQNSFKGCYLSLRAMVGDAN